MGEWPVLIWPQLVATAMSAMVASSVSPLRWERFWTSVVPRYNVQMLKIYLDNCCYNRPFDNQKDRAIGAETQAKMFIQSLIK